MTTIEALRASSLDETDLTGDVSILDHVDLSQVVRQRIAYAKDLLDAIAWHVDEEESLETDWEAIQRLDRTVKTLSAFL